MWGIARRSRLLAALLVFAGAVTGGPAGADASTPAVAAASARVAVGASASAGARAGAGAGAGARTGTGTPQDATASLRSGARRVQRPPYPAAQRVAAAERYLAGRDGDAALAVIDDRGRLRGTAVRRRFHSASVVKSMLLVAYLRMLAARHRALRASDRALLYPMIHVSDNHAASAVLAIVGEPALDRLTRDAGMADFRASKVWWALDEVSAADVARFFYRFEGLTPARFLRYARSLLMSIESSQSWGIPAVARPEFTVIFKGGWLPESEGLVNQAALLERPGIAFAMTVLTDHDPSMAYGEQTIAGVTLRLLGRAR